MHPFAPLMPPSFQGSGKFCKRCGGAPEEHVFGRICDMVLIEKRVKNDGTGRKIWIESDGNSVQRTSANQRHWRRRSQLPDELKATTTVSAR